MAKSSGLNFNLPSVDDLFSTEEERAEARLEKVVNLSPSEISDFPNHPFKVRMDAAMQEMTESVKQYGVLVPALVRPKPEGGYEMVAGHRRKKAADLAGLAEIPCIVRQLTDDEATIIMVDSNLQREQILPSEKAFAYKMKLDAMKRQAGRPSKENGATVLPHFSGKKSREILAEQSGESHEQIRKYIRLTHLIPEILELYAPSGGAVLPAKRRTGRLVRYHGRDGLHPIPRPGHQNAPDVRSQDWRGTAGQRRTRFHYEGGKAQSKRTVQNSKGKNQPVFCAGDAHAEDRGHHC